MFPDRQRLPHPAAFLPWLIASLSLLWLKRDLIIELRINPVILSSTSVNETFLTDLACMRIDFPLLFIIIPAFIAGLFYFVPKRWCLTLLTAASAILVFLVYTEGRSLTLIGQFASLNLLLSALSWGRAGGGASDYLPVSGLIKLILALCIVLTSAFLARRMEKRRSPDRPSYPRWLLLLYLVPTLLITSVAWLLPAPPSRVTTSIATVLFDSFLGRDTDVDHTRGLQTLSLADLHSRYRVLAHAPGSERDPAYWRIAKHQNVIFLVWETGPARYLDLAGDLKAFPNMSRLREHALIGTRHYSTYPYTNRAQLSLYTSLYPYAKKNFQAFPHRTLPGAISTLRSEGYETGIYGPLWTGESDDNMYKSIGFNIIGVPPGGLIAKGKTWQQKRDVDLASLQMMEADIQRWNDTGERFAVSFVPQIGHGPWPDMSDDSGRESIADRGLALMHLQDQFLGNLIEMLDRNHILSDTIIVITSDHGVRDKVDDPTFDVGAIDNYSYKVPLMVYCSSISKRTDIPWLTSHVDIAPTVLDLLGVETGRSLEEGAPIWQSDLQDRTSFFLASHYMGADGFYRNNEFFMEKYLSGSAYASPALHFGNQPLPDAQASEVAKTTSGLNEVQAAMFYKLAFDKRELDGTRTLRAASGNEHQSPKGSQE